MNGRVLAILLILWVLIISPTFCVAGVLEHACTDCSEEDACGHEEDCQDDPCLEVIARTSSSTADGLNGMNAVALLRVAVVLDVRQANDCWFPATRDWVRNVPVPQSDLPLLI